jgi:hypothetical protein
MRSRFNARASYRLKSATIDRGARMRGAIGEHYPRTRILIALCQIGQNPTGDPRPPHRTHEPRLAGFQRHARG